MKEKKGSLLLWILAGLAGYIYLKKRGFEFPTIFGITEEPIKLPHIEPPETVSPQPPETTTKPSETTTTTTTTTTEQPETQTPIPTPEQTPTKTFTITIYWKNAEKFEELCEQNNIKHEVAGYPDRSHIKYKIEGVEKIIKYKILPEVKKLEKQRQPKVVIGSGGEILPIISESKEENISIVNQKFKDFAEDLGNSKVKVLLVIDTSVYQKFLSDFQKTKETDKIPLDYTPEKSQVYYKIEIETNSSLANYFKELNWEVDRIKLKQLKIPVSTETDKKKEVIIIPTYNWGEATIIFAKYGVKWKILSVFVYRPIFLIGDRDYMFTFIDNFIKENKDEIIVRKRPYIVGNKLYNAILISKGGANGK